MKAALTLKGGPMWPAQSKARQLGVDRLGWEANDPQIDPQTNGGINVIEPVRGNGFSIFLMRDPAWDGYADPPEKWAAKFSSDITRLKLEGKQCALLADIEVHDSAWILHALRELRRIRSGRGLTWSMEPLQRGIMSSELVDFINADKMVTVAPQLYRGNMSKVSERVVINDLAASAMQARDGLPGIDPLKILPFYGYWCEGWDGFLYDLLQIL